jgi:hypothetical protein
VWALQVKAIINFGGTRFFHGGDRALFKVMMGHSSGERKITKMATGQSVIKPILHLPK